MPSMLSRGQRHRVAITRSLAIDTQVMLFEASTLVLNRKWLERSWPQ